MASSSKFHLIDAGGNALDERYQQAVSQLEREFFQRFPHIDPVDVCNVVEEAARKVALHEQGKGPVRNVKPFLLTVFQNTMKSLFRRGHYAIRQVPLSGDFDQLAAFAHDGHLDEIEAAILANRVLDGVDRRKREILAAKALGYSNREVAQQLGTTVNHINVLVHRARESAKDILKRKSHPR